MSAMPEVDALLEVAERSDAREFCIARRYAMEQAALDALDPMVRDLVSANIEKYPGPGMTLYLCHLASLSHAQIFEMVHLLQAKAQPYRRFEKRWNAPWMVWMPYGKIRFLLQLYCRKA